MTEKSVQKNPWVLLDAAPAEEQIWEQFLSRGLIHNEQRPGLKIHCKSKKSKDLMTTAVGITDESYRLSFGETVLIEYVTLRGLYYGFIKLAELWNSNSIPAEPVFDYPRFQIRGIIEGFYGTPWTHRQRKEMIRFLPEIRMNSFFYGPKDDPWHREKWNEVYPEKELERLSELQNVSSRQDTIFWYGIGPGLSIRYSSQHDRDLLLNKLFQIYDIGVRHFGLFLDDIPEALFYREDIEQFNDLAGAHIFIINDTYRRLIQKDPEIKLAVCPTKYWGRPGYYISRLGQEIDFRIHMFHTGPEICSGELRLADAAEMERITNRPVLYWDNYPVNDAAMTNELHIGPYDNRDRHLFRASEGIIANGMEYAEASKIPFFTIGEYLWNPETYDSAASLKKALRKIVGETDWEAFLPFTENNNTSCLAPDESSAVQTAIEKCRFCLQTGDNRKAADILEHEYLRLLPGSVLFEHGMENKALSEEIKPWAEKYKSGVRVIELIIKLIRAEDKISPELLKEFHKISNEFESCKFSVFSDYLTTAIKEMFRLTENKHYRQGEPKNES